MGALMLCSAQVIEQCRFALRLCVELIIPSLFPFFVVSILLNRLGFPYAVGRLLSPVFRKLFKVSGAGGSALVMGLCGGYPLGAAYIADMHSHDVIDANEAEKLLAFCNNSGPAFIIGAVGAGAFGSARVGMYLYFIHISAAFITGIILRGAKMQRDNTAPVPMPQNVSSAFPEAVKQAVISVLNVCGFVVIFTVIAGLLDMGGHFSLLTGRLSSMLGTPLSWSRALLTGLLELGSGCGLLRGMEASPVNAALAAFLLGWGGVSVHFQTLALFAGTKIKGALHFAGRLMSAIIAAVLAYAIFSLT